MYESFSTIKLHPDERSKEKIQQNRQLENNREANQEGNKQHTGTSKKRLN